jgi:hypothetical protein
LAQLRDDTLSFLDEPQEPLRMSVRALGVSVQERLRGAVHALFSSENSPPRSCPAAVVLMSGEVRNTGRDTNTTAAASALTRAHGLIMASFRLLAVQLEDTAWREIVPYELVEYLRSAEGEMYVSVYVCDLLAAHDDGIQGFVSVVSTFQQQQQQQGTGGVAAGEGGIAVERLRILLVRQLRDHSAPCYNEDCSSSVPSLLLSLVEWAMDQVHGAAVYTEETLASPERFSSGVQSLLQLLLPLQDSRQ